MKQNRELLKREIISQASALHFRMMMCNSECHKKLYDVFAEYILKLIDND